MTALDHWADSASAESDEPEYYCDYDSCSEAFSDEDELRDHEVTVHFYCDACDREFQDENSIRSHRNSKVHRGQSMCCYFCNKPYVTTAGVFHHLSMTTHMKIVRRFTAVTRQTIYLTYHTRSRCLLVGIR
ncbi:hypothetical protein CPLU01_15585 [Colletotrichum plurivorum]|uniref:C2H2-type domain-containing protein n=1 Tax=Colletotrichum plurivorum TaxID=2175906 RepID=A0A8H6MUU0_9PEZI|nr:hypothetical protein CPLU01_15585 [Colletotrichum plurivorum]